MAGDEDDEDKTIGIGLNEDGTLNEASEDYDDEEGDDE